MPNTLLAYPSLQQKCTNARAKLVLPESIRQTPLCIVGESLGSEEVLNERYFCGKAGYLFDKLLKDVGLIRGTIHVTNVVKVQPPGNKVSRLPELGLTRDDFIPYLKEELQHVKPRVILAVGQHAMEVLTGLEGVTRQRGSCVRCRLTGADEPVVITLHPSYLQRGQMQLYPYVRSDFRQFAEFVFGLRKSMVSFTQIIDPSVSQVIDYLHNIYVRSTATCFDIETVGRRFITCIGFTFDNSSAICIPFRHNGLRNRWTEAEQLMILNAMRQVYKKPGLVKIAQNMHYDMHYLLPLLGFPREPLFDTLYAHHLIHPDMRHDLGFIMSNYCDMPYHKDETDDWEAKNLPYDKTLWEYNIKDVIGTHRSYINLKKDLIELNLYNFFTGYVMPFRRVLFEMEYRGINVDIEKRAQREKEVVENELPDVLYTIAELTGINNLNPNSSAQVGTYLESIGLPIQKTVKGNYTVTEDKLEELYARFPQYKRIMELIICARKLKSKTLGTYLRAPLSKDGRLRTSFGITKTGRLSSRSNHHGEGTNLQNQPKRLRNFYIPDSGNVFLTPDLEQAEALVQVFYMKAESLKQRMLKKEKIHAVVAEWIDNKSISELTPERYRDIKATVYGSNYKMGINKFATTIKKTVAEAKILQAKYFSVLPELPAYHKHIEELVTTKRKITTCYGRVRVFTGDIDSDVLYSAYAQIPQSTVADTINLGILGLWHVKPDNIHLLLQVHDEVVISLPPELVEWFKPFIKAHLETLRWMIIGEDKLTIPVDIGTPKSNWYGKEN